MIFYFTGTGNSLWAAKEIGKDKLRTLINRGIVTYVRKPTFFSQGYIRLNSLPQRSLRAYLINHHHPSL